MVRFAGTLLLGAFRGTLAGAATVVVFLTAAFIARDAGLALMLFLGLSAVFWFFATFIHEIGHAVAAWVYGWRVHQIVVGHIGFAPRTKKWSLERRPPAASDIGGWVRATPGPLNKHRTGEIAYILGGVLANVLSALICLAAIALLPMNSIMTTLALGFAASSIIVGIANLDPWRGPERWESDGRSLMLALARSSKGLPPDLILEAEVRVYADLVEEQPLHPQDLATLRGIPAEEAVRGSRGDLLKSAAIVSGDLVWLRRLILESERQGATLAPYDLGSLALSAAVVDNDATAGREYLERVPIDIRGTTPDYLRALAAVEHVGGRTEEAKAAVAAIRRMTANQDWGDNDDRALFQAIEAGSPLPPLGTV